MFNNYYFPAVMESVEHTIYTYISFQSNILYPNSELMTKSQVHHSFHFSAIVFPFLTNKY